MRFILAAALCAGIVAAPATGRKKTDGMAAVDLDPTSRGAVSGTGLESRDIDMLADQVMRELLTRADITGVPTPPRVVIDSERLANNSSQRLDKDMISDALRASLNRAAAGRLRFISRESAAMIEEERALKRSGTVDVGTRRLAKATAGVDYRLIGKITSLDSRDNNSGRTQRRMQIVLELVDLETGEIPWTSQPYVTLRASGDDVVYR